jgi:signal transduction histidine kinase
LSEPAPPVRAAVLVVDDSPANRKAVEAVLTPLGVDIVHAGSGRDALRQLLSREFALLLVDVQMGDIDGFETAALIRKRPRNRDTPIIFMTAHDQTESDLSRGYSLGAVDFVHTPLNPEVLFTKTNVFVELFHRTQEVRRLYVEAQEASRAKSEFLNMAAHELRTPLSVVRGYLSMLLEGVFEPLPEAPHQALEIMDAKAAELNTIVDSLLTAARIDEARVPIRSETVDLVTAVREAVERAEGRRALLDAALTFAVPDRQVAVKADPAHVARILDNLINNALTYCAGTPEIHLNVGDAVAPSVVIQDNGVGVPEDRWDEIFDRFVRIEDEAIGPTQGTGLGLHISRELARLSGGDLRLEWSERGRGSRFVLTLQRAGRGRLDGGRRQEGEQVGQRELAAVEDLKVT